MQVVVKMSLSTNLKKTKIALFTRKWNGMDLKPLQLLNPKLNFKTEVKY